MNVGDPAKNPQTSATHIGNAGSARSAGSPTSGEISPLAPLDIMLATGRGRGGVEAVYADASIWLTRKMLGVLYDVNVHTMNEHLKRLFADSELPAPARSLRKSPRPTPKTNLRNTASISSAY